MVERNDLALSEVGHQHELASRSDLAVCGIANSDTVLIAAGLGHRKLEMIDKSGGKRLFVLFGRYGYCVSFRDLVDDQPINAETGGEHVKGGRPRAIRLLGEF